MITQDQFDKESKERVTLIERNRVLEASISILIRKIEAAKKMIGGGVIAARVEKEELQPLVSEKNLNAGRIAVIDENRKIFLEAQGAAVKNAQAIAAMTPNERLALQKANYAAANTKYYIIGGVAVFIVIIALCVSIFRRG